MKLITCLSLMLCVPVLLFSQINLRYNGIRSGDEIIKQQVDYKDPGRDGENVIWDFSKLKSVNDEYTLTYRSPYLLDGSYKMGKDTFNTREVDPASLIVGIEHNTMYYYKQEANKLEVLGHENPTTLLHYTKPMTAQVFPTNYGQTHTSEFQSEGMYSKRIGFESKGSVKITADAYGMIILPSGDTIKHILRIKTVQVINETVNTRKPQNFNMTCESYKWYAKGYRYPIFETIRTINNQDTLQTNEFKTAFFFPPQEHLYLDNDKDNLAVLDSLWNIGSGEQESITDPNRDYTTRLSYNFYPNPVQSQLTIEYYLEQPTPITISIYTMEGKLQKTISRPKQDSGMFTEYVDCNNFTTGTYILRIEANNKITSDKIIKK